MSLVLKHNLDIKAEEGKLSPTSDVLSNKKGSF